MEGILIGIIGSLLPLLILYRMYRSIISYVGEKFLWLSGMMEFLPVDKVFSTGSGGAGAGRWYWISGKPPDNPEAFEGIGLT